VAYLEDVPEPAMPTWTARSSWQLTP